MTAIRLELLPQARHNLSQFMLRKAHNLTKQLGFGYVDRDDAPSSFDELKAAWEHSKRTGLALPVWSGGSDRTIYTNPGANWAFRFWHDSLHMIHGLAFTLEDELKIALMHCEEIAQEFGRNSLELSLILSDTAGQSLYAAEHDGEFPEDQLAFATGHLVDHPVALKVAA